MALKGAATALFADLGLRLASLTTELDHQLHTALQELCASQEQCEQQRQVWEQKVQELEAERAAMTAPGATDDDIVTLNVAGEVMATRRRTLCQVSGSLLEAMFSGRWESSLARDAEGRVFLELNPVCFRSLLNALTRDGRRSGPSSPPDGQPLRSVRRLAASARTGRHESDESGDLHEMLDYLGISFPPTEVPVQLWASAMVTVDSTGRRATNTSLRGASGWALSRKPLPVAPQQPASWAVDVCSLGPTGTIYLGVYLGLASAPRHQRAGAHLALSPSLGGSYGWSGGYVHVAGVRRAAAHDFCQGDKVSFTLDVDANTLTMTVTRQDGSALPAARLKLPTLTSDHAWYMHFNLSEPYSAVETSQISIPS